MKRGKVETVNIDNCKPIYKLHIEEFPNQNPVNEVNELHEEPDEFDIIEQEAPVAPTRTLRSRAIPWI